MVLIPTPLFDYRYFMVPWTIYVLEIDGINPVIIKNALIRRVSFNDQ